MARILVIDDELVVRQIIRAVLESRNFDVSEARSGEEALQCVRGMQFDVAIVDYVMPGGMDGIQTMEAIRRIHRTIPFIFISAYGTIRRAVETMQLGAYDFLEKPFDNSELIKRVERALGAIEEEEPGAQYVSHAVQIIRERYSECGLNGATIARDLDITADYLGEIFKRHTGQKLLDFLHETRVAEAAHRLASSPISIKAVHAKCGYHSHSELDAHFKKLKGCSPTEWRRRHRELAGRNSAGKT